MPADGAGWSFCAIAEPRVENEVAAANLTTGCAGGSVADAGRFEDIDRAISRFFDAVDWQVVPGFRIFDRLDVHDRFRPWQSIRHGKFEIACEGVRSFDGLVSGNEKMEIAACRGRVRGQDVVRVRILRL